MLCVENDGRRKDEGRRGRSGGGSPALDSRRAKIAAGTLGRPVLGLRGEEALEDVGVMPRSDLCPDVERRRFSSAYLDNDPGLLSFA